MTAAMVILAAIEWLGLAQWILNLLFTLSMAYVASQTRKIDTLKRELEKKADELIEAKFDRHAGTLRSSIESLSRELARINQRLEKGDGQFEDLAERGHKVRLEVAVQMGELQKWFLTTFATKEDLKELNRRIDAIEPVYGAGAGAGRKAS